jgi:hypothetical protein
VEGTVSAAYANDGVVSIADAAVAPVNSAAVVWNAFLLDWDDDSEEEAVHAADDVTVSDVNVKVKVNDNDNAVAVRVDVSFIASVRLL